MQTRKRVMTVVLTGVMPVMLGAARASAQEVSDTTGPYKVVMEMDPSLPDHTIYRPQDLAAAKEKLPVVAWGNGGCYAGGNFSARHLSEVASYGFVVVANGAIDPEVPALLERIRAAQKATSGGGQLPPLPANAQSRRTKTSQLYETMDWARVQSASTKSPYFHKLAPEKIAVMGSSCGGLQALVAAGDPRVKAAVILNSGIIRKRPASAAAPSLDMELPGTPETLQKLHTPVIYLIGGKKDIAYGNAEQDFAEIGHVPVFKANLEVGHSGTSADPHGGKFAEVSTQWLLWQLKANRTAKRMFTGAACTLCRAPEWSVERKQFN